MEYREREEFKESAWGLIKDGGTPEERFEGFLMLVEAHYHRNPSAPDFPIYASQWIAANKDRIDRATLELLNARFPAPSVRLITDGYSDWNSFGDVNYR